MSSTISMRDSMSAMRGLFIDDLEKKRSQSREGNSHDEHEPYERVSIYSITEENRPSEYNHTEVDDNERDKSGMSAEP